MQAHYANIMAYRITPNELVLEFGNFFAGQDDNRAQADHRDFDVRVVMSADVLDGMLHILNQAREQRDEARKKAVEKPSIPQQAPLEEKRA